MKQILSRPVPSDQLARQDGTEERAEAADPQSRADASRANASRVHGCGERVQTGLTGEDAESSQKRDDEDHRHRERRLSYQCEVDRREGEASSEHRNEADTLNDPAEYDRA